MKNDKCSNKTLRVCGPGGVRKNKGKWQAVVTVADEMTGKKVQRTKNTGVPCLKPVSYTHLTLPTTERV